jgi:hypothetical protein
MRSPYGDSFATIPQKWSRKPPSCRWVSADLDLAAFMVVSAAKGIGANATNEFIDARLASEIGVLLKIYLTGAEDVPNSL